MPTITIEGKRVDVGEDWGQLSNEDKNRRVEAIAKQQMIVSPTAPDQYRGTVLPFAKNAAGETRFDITAGLPGTIARSAYDAFNLPGDVLVGDQQGNRQQVIDPMTGRPSNQFIDRASNFAQWPNLSSPATIAGRASMMQSPTAKDLRKLGGADLDAARATGAEFRGSAVRQMTDDLLDQYRLQGRVGKLAENTRGAVANLAPTYGTNTDIATLMAHRETLLKEAVTSTNAQEAAAAGQAVKGIDEFLNTLPGKDIVGGTATGLEINELLQRGRGNWAAAERANVISGELSPATKGLLERAQAQAASTASGRNLDNALRQKARAFLEDEHNLFGFSPAEIKMLEQVRDGTAPLNAVRSFANLLGGGGGLGQAVTAGGVGTATSGAALAGGAAPAVAAGLGTGAAVGTGLLGRGAKALENLMATRGAQELEQALRLRSPEGQRRLANQPDQWSARDTAVLRALMPPGLLQTMGQGDQPPAQPGYVTTDDPAWTRRLPPGFI